MKPGEVYRVKTYEQGDKPEHWVHYMDRYMGKEVILDTVHRHSNGSMSISLVDGGGWSFEECDFEPLTILELNDKDFLI